MKEDVMMKALRQPMRRPQQGYTCDRVSDWSLATQEL